MIMVILTWSYWTIQLKTPTYAPLSDLNVRKILESLPEFFLLDFTAGPGHGGFSCGLELADCGERGAAGFAGDH